ncbi:SRPBCC family protein [Candidatus Pandoraea novymonadis]|uniref:SRPBCC family protein n=1 Tax=Candidatus Pandoraea novymonadis TaxID=1808959 RepID=UPI000D0813B2|nr:SRPBCC family protein [Candidatus Pandoraea novymonadis]
MHYEHLIEVNKPINTLILTRKKLWRGLVLRATQPENFLVGLNDCIIREGKDGTLERKLNFSQTRILDRVIFTTLHSVRYEIEATNEHPGGSLTTSIEEPSEDYLFVRFNYLTTLTQVQDEDSAYYMELVKSAYQEADFDTIRRIRQLGEENLLG